MLTDFRDRIRKELETARFDAMERLISAKGDNVPFEQGYLRGVQQSLTIFDDCFDEFTNVMEDA